MKKVASSLFCTCVFLCFYCLAPGQASGSRLIVKLSNLKSETGKIMIAAFDQAELFLGDEAVAALKVPVKELVDNKLAITGLEFGRYALSVFHDVNDNDELDTNLLKIPKEPFGFSNNAKARFGPPKFRAASFEFAEDGQVIEIRLRRIGVK